MTHRPEPALVQGARAAWPICLGYVPIGLAFGVLARRAGLAPWQVGLMSLLVFAGSSQFIAVAMLQAGASAASVVAATFVVNLRHLLMSSALAVHLRDRGRRFLSAFAYGVTDESFAVNLARFRDGGWSPASALALNQTANAAWVGSTVVGAWAGQALPPHALGVDFALPAMFLALLVLQVRSRPHLVSALASGALALAAYLVLPGNIHVVVAAVAGATVAFLLCPGADREAGP